MSLQLSPGYTPTGPQVQIQVAAGGYTGNYLGLSAEDGFDGYLTIVQSAQALTFTLDQETKCKIPFTYTDCSLKLVMGGFDMKATSRIVAKSSQTAFARRPGVV